MSLTNSHLQHQTLIISLAIQNQLAQLGNQCLLWNPSVLHLLGGYSGNPLVLCMPEIIGVNCLSASLFPSNLLSLTKAVQTCSLLLHVIYVSSSPARPSPSSVCSSSVTSTQQLESTL